MTSSEVAGALDAYLRGDGQRSHVDRSGNSSGLGASQYAEMLREARSAEVASWDAWWGGHLVDRPKRILDAGCGAGFCARALGEYFSADEVVALDVEPAAIDVVNALARDYPPLLGCVGRLEDLDQGEFDLIVCRTVLEHVDDPRRSLDSLIAALAPGGSLFLETPNYLFPYEPHVRLWMLPKSPKSLLRLTCRLTGRNPEFVDHLQFSCDTLTLSRWARRPGYVVRNLAASKIGGLGRESHPTSAIGRRVAAGARRLGQPGQWGLGALGRLPITPSVQLLVTRER